MSAPPIGGARFAYADETSSIRQNRARSSHVISLTDDPFVPIRPEATVQETLRKRNGVIGLF